MRLHGILSWLFLFVMASMGVNATTEDIDLSAMSLDDLLALDRRIGEEITERLLTLEDNRIGQGTYLVGRDIHSGFFEFTCLESECYNWGDPDNDIYIESDGDRVYLARDVGVGGHVMLFLEDGMLFTINGCTGTIMMMGSPSWAP